MMAAIIAALSSLRGPLGKAALYAGGAVALALAAWLAVAEHDKRILGEQAAEEAAVIAEQQVSDLRRAVVEANAEATAAIARASAAANIKREIARAPVSSGCAASPAIAAALDGLRSARPGAGPPGGAGGAPVLLPGPSTPGAASR